MPTYDYECAKCGNFEMFQSMKDKPITSCPTCKGKVTRLIGGGTGIIFKGSGFYATDYKKSASKGEATCQKQNSKEGCSSCPHAKPK